MSPKPDFQALNACIAANPLPLLKSMLPAGKEVGREYVCCGDLEGHKGESLSINLDTGLWSDFSTGDKGRDFIILYAAKYRVGQGKAYKAISQMPEYAMPQGATAQPPVVRAKKKDDYVITSPPADAPACSCVHWKWDKPVSIAKVCRGDGSLYFYEARYEPPGERKQFCPWSWDSNSSR